MNPLVFLMFPAFFACASPLISQPHDSSEPIRLYVAPIGNDRWTGRSARINDTKTDGPLATMEGARNVIRGLKARLGEVPPVRVLFASGSYRLTKPVHFGPEDSGSSQSPVSYEAAPGARP